MRETTEQCLYDQRKDELLEGSLHPHTAASRGQQETAGNVGLPVCVIIDAAYTHRSHTQPDHTHTHRSHTHRSRT